MLADQVRCWKKLNWATGQNLTPIGLERVFQRSTQAEHSLLAVKMSKLPPMVPSRITQHWKCKFGKRWRRRTATCGEKTCVIADGFPWRINCFPVPNDSHLLMAYWTSAFICLSKLLIAGPVIVANARFCSFNPSGPSLIQFVANNASSRMLNWQDPGSHWSAHTADTVALELKWPLPWIYSLQELFELVILLEPHVCVSLELTQVVVRDCQHYEKIHLAFLPRRRVHWQWYFFWRYCTFFSTTKSCLILVPTWEDVHHQGFWYSATAKHKRHCCQKTSFLLRVFGSNRRVHHNDDQKPCNSCGEKLSVFLVLRSTGAATESPCRSRIALKRELSENSSQTSTWPSKESHSTGAPVRSRESGSSSKSSVHKSSHFGCIYLRNGRTSTDNHHGALTAKISTFNRFPDFRPCWILLGSSCQ